MLPQVPEVMCWPHIVCPHLVVPYMVKGSMGSLMSSASPPNREARSAMLTPGALAL